MSTISLPQTVEEMWQIDARYILLIGIDLFQGFGAVQVATKREALSCQSKFCLEHECFLQYALLPIILSFAIVPYNLDVIWTQPIHIKHMV